MEYIINPNDCHFHDSTVTDINYDGRILSLYIPESRFEDTYDNIKIEIPIEEFDINISYIKQFAVFHRVRYRGKEISISKMKKFFKKGKALQINEFLISPDSQYIAFEGDLIPYSSRKAFYNKIIIELNDYEFIRFVDNSKKHI